MSTKLKTPKRRPKQSAAVRLMQAVDRLIIAAQQAEQARQELLREQGGGR